MSTTTVAPTYVSQTTQTCKVHPNKMCLEFKLPAEPEGELLSLTIVSMRHAAEPSQIGVIDDLLVGCRPYRAPSGYDILDNRTVHFFYPDNIGTDVPNEARGKIREKLERRIGEILSGVITAPAKRRMKVSLKKRFKKIIDERNSTHRRDPQTHLVHKR